jgi:circadian clock protein KaiC
MTETGKARLTCVTTGVPTLDTILGGGFPEFSFNLIAGDPGAGKTTLCHQIMFANATPERPAVYFTVLGEPPLKMLRYQQQYTFFDPEKISDGSIQFVNLSRDYIENLGRTLQTILTTVEQRAPGFVFVDSFRSLASAPRPADAPMDMTTFVQRLTIHMTSLQVTTFLIGEYQQQEPRDYALFTIADGILWLSQNVYRNSMVRKIQAIKMRGQETQPGLHTLRITGAGIRAFPRMVKPLDHQATLRPLQYLSTGIADLDEMMGGGVVAGSAVLISGPSGCGKSALAIQFLADGVAHGEPGVLAVFEESPLKYLEQAHGFGIDLEEMIRTHMLTLVYVRPLDLSVDETLYHIQAAAAERGATRVVIDSLTGLEIALAPTFEADFRESLYRLLGTLTGDGITMMMTVENTDDHTQLRFSPHPVSFMSNDLILMRYVEIEGQLKRILAVIKSRSRHHSQDLRPFEITSHGLVLGARIEGFVGLIGGVARRREPERPAYPGLTDREVMVLTVLQGRDADEDALTHRSGLQPDVLGRVLVRLVELEYAERRAADGRTLYRAVERRN